MKLDFLSRLLSDRVMTLLIVFVVVLAAAYCLSFNLADPDLWGHVQYGQDTISQGSLHTTTTYSFTAEGYRWINHENLSELVFAMLVNVGGVYALTCFKFMAGIFLLGLLIASNLRRGASLLATSVVVMLVAANLAPYWSFRPQLLTFSFFACMIWLLEWAFQGWHFTLKLPGRFRFNRTGSQPPVTERDGTLELSYQRLNRLWWMPPLLCVWTNSHGGFAAGLCIYLAYLGMRFVEVFCRNGLQSHLVLKRLALMGFVGVLATFVNPYGPGLHLWLYATLSVPNPEITEWASTNLIGPYGTRLVPLMAIALFSFVTSKRGKDATKTVILLIILSQSLAHLRHIPFFAILCGFWIPIHLTDFLNRFTVRRASLAGTTNSICRFGIAGCCLAAIIALGTMLLPRLIDIQVKRTEYPVAAFQFVTDEQLSGRMVVTYNWAQYAIAAFGNKCGPRPHCPISFDGRFNTCYPQQILDMHFDFLMGTDDPAMRYRSPESGPLNVTRVLHYKQPELVVVSRRQKPSIEVMEQCTDQWTLLYQDERAQVWGLKARFDIEMSPDYLPPSRRRISDESQTGCVTWPALPNARRMNEPVVPRGIVKN
jgi:hypothetical protein